MEKDIIQIDGINREKSKMEMLLRSLARNESTISNNNVLIKDIDNITSDRDLLISRNTLADYLKVLDRLHIIKNQNSFMYKFVQD